MFQYEPSVELTCRALNSLISHIIESNSRYYTIMDELYNNIVRNSEIYYSNNHVYFIKHKGMVESYNVIYSN